LNRGKQIFLLSSRLRVSNNERPLVGVALLEMQRQFSSNLLLAGCTHRPQMLSQEPVQVQPVHVGKPTVEHFPIK
jgi:hypothetical protein